MGEKRKGNAPPVSAPIVVNLGICANVQTTKDNSYKMQEPT